MKQNIMIIAVVAGLALIAVVVFVVISAKKDHDRGVVDRYQDVIVPLTPTAANEQARLDARMLAGILGAIDKLEAGMGQMNEDFLVSKNENEGVYTVAQEEHIAGAYSQYLLLRKALFHIAFRHKEFASTADQELQDQSFLLAYASGLTLYRNAVIFVLLFRDQPNARQKLNEANPITGTPAGMFDEMYKNVTSKKNVGLVVEGLREFEERRARLEKLPLVKTIGNEKLLERLDKYEEELESAYTKLSEGRSDILWTTLKSGVTENAYETQSMISVMISHIRVPLHSKGLSPESVRDQLRPKLKPGDILLSRRDGYLTNTFLPGHWGHAAMYLGSAEEIRALGTGEKPADLAEALKGYAGKDKDGFAFAAIEAIGEGVRFSSAEYAMSANSIAVLRPKLTPEQIQTAIIRAMALRGTPYDFSFDMGSQDKIICTELVYRAYAPHLEVPFEEVMGRKTLKPDGMLRELSPAADSPRTEFVLFGKAVDGKFEAETLEELLATVE